MTIYQRQLQPIGSGSSFNWSIHTSRFKRTSQEDKETIVNTAYSLTPATQRQVVARSTQNRLPTPGLPNKSLELDTLHASRQLLEAAAPAPHSRRGSAQALGFFKKRRP